MGKLGDLVVNIGANTEQLNKDLKKSQRELKRFGDGFKKMGENMTKSITLPLVAIGAASFKLAMDFEASMAQVKAVSGATAQEFKLLEKNALDLGSSTKFTASEVSSLQLEFSKLGFSAQEITKVTESTLALAQATGSDLATSAEVAGATLRGFGLDAAETGRVTDVMAASFSSSALDMSSFKDAMKFVAPVAKAAGISIEETTAMLGALANNGIKGSQAGTALRRIISDLGNTSGGVAGAIEKLANQGINLADAKDEVGRSAQSALLVLTENIGVTDDLTNSFNNAAGTAKDMAGIMDDTSAGALARMGSALEGAGIIIGKQLAPHVERLAKFVSDLATKFSELSEGTQATIIKVAAFAAALGPILIILPKLIARTRLLRRQLKKINPTFIAISAGVAIAVAAWNTFMKKADKVEDTIKNLNKQIAKESIETKILFDRVKDVNLQEGNRQKALEKLQELYPDYIGNLDLNKSTLKDIEDAERNVITAISDRVKAQVQASAQAKALEAQVNLTEKLLDAELDLREQGFDPVALKMFFDKINKEVERLAAGEIKAVDLGEFFADLTKDGLGAEIGDALSLRGIFSPLTVIDVLGTKMEEANTRLALINSTIEDTGKVIADTGEDIADTGEIIEGVVEDLDDASTTMSKPISIDSKPIQELANDFDESAKTIVESTNNILDAVDSTNDKIVQFTQIMNDAIKGVAESFIESSLDMVAAALVAGQPIENFGLNLVGAFGELAQQLGKIAIGFGITVDAIKEKLLKNPKLAVVAGIALMGLGKLASAAADKAISENMPALAEGGLAFGPTTALVGDNRNASIDPEVIAPLSKLRDLLGGSTSVHGRISGDDILISNSRAMRDRNRFA